jgi:hypothetical protein
MIPSAIVLTIAANVEKLEPPAHCAEAKRLARMTGDRLLRASVDNTCGRCSDVVARS